MYARNFIKGGSSTAISTALKRFGIRCFHNSQVPEKNENIASNSGVEKEDMKALFKARAEQARLLGLTSKGMQSRLQKLHPGSIEARQELEKAELGMNKKK